MKSHKVTAKKIETLLRESLTQNGDLVYALYEYELEEHIDYWYNGLKADQNEFVFAVTENTDHVAMVLITKDKTLYINEDARDKLFEWWGDAYKKNMETIIPAMADQIANDFIAVYGVHFA